MKVFYLHVPKTAGSSINAFFSAHLRKTLLHIESMPEINKDELERYSFVSGHVPLDKIDSIINLEHWDTIASFREPISYVASHIKWIRKLADPDQKSRFDNHPKIFQDIALKMAGMDFSNPKDIHNLIDWLESINFYYLHNTQSIYLNSAIQCENPSETQVSVALKNLYRIDMICIQDNLDPFFKFLSNKYGWQFKNNSPKVNVNQENYGLNINDAATVEALERLIEIDRKIYLEACLISDTILNTTAVDKKKPSLPPTKYENTTEVFRGSIDNISSNNIHGWVAEVGTNKSLEIALYIDDRYIESTISKLVRTDVAEKGHHQTGHCGFSFKLDSEVKMGSLIRIDVKGSDFSLSKQYS